MYQASQGTAECALASIMGAHGQTYTQTLESPHLPGQRATITVRAEQAMESSDLVKFELAAKCGAKNSSRFKRCVVLLFVIASLPRSATLCFWQVRLAGTARVCVVFVHASCFQLLPFLPCYFAL